VSLDVYLEIGAKRVFACAVDWPGWCRSGCDEGAALEALAAYGPRYVTALRQAAAGLKLPDRPGALRVTDRVAGGAITDFGAPGAVPAADRRPFDTGEATRQEAILGSSWGAFDRAVRAAEGHRLATGPRGGGRDLEKMLGHVLDAEKAYLSKLGGRYGKADARPDPREDLDAVRDVVLHLLAGLARGESPPRTPRTGSLWTPRYFVRRSAWHALDHAWEIEDRAARAPD
jgi:hypothetical protein